MSDPGKPAVEVNRFPALPGSGTLRLTNGDSDGANRVTSAVVNLNGRKILSPNDFSSQIDTLEREVTLAAENQLEVEVRGAEDSVLRIEILDASAPLPAAWLEAAPAFITWGEYVILSWGTENADSCTIEPGIGPVEPAGSLTVTPSGPTTYTLTASGPGGVAMDSAAVEVYFPEPFAELYALPDSIEQGASSRLAWSTQYAETCTIEPDIGPVGPLGSLDVSPAQSTLYTLNAAGPGGEAQAFASVTVVDPGADQPEGSFGAFYQDLVPGNATAVYHPRRFSVVTGSAAAADGMPVPGVTVRVLGHPEYGSVRTCNGGVYSIPVEGGGTMTVVLEAENLLTAHRGVRVPWNDIAAVDPVIMTPQDSLATEVNFDGSAGTVATHRSSVTADDRGPRSCTLVFTGDTRAFSVTADGVVLEELGSITVRATEYPVPGSMPAQLPPATAYTYCVELAAEGVERVSFDRPVVVWVENFLGFDVGERVPAGFYDRDRGYWIPSDDGYVVRLLDTSGDGVADALDLDGDGLPDDLDGDGLFSGEVSGLDDPSRYPPGSSFWRVEVTHFTPWDYNWPYGPPEDAGPPDPGGEPDADQQREEERDCWSHTGSFVEDRSRIFHEDIPVPGTGIRLHYASNRVEGYRNTITVPASGDSVPGSLRRIVAGVEIAGRVLEQALEPVPGQKAEISWDGRDHLGRKVTGGRDARVKLDYVYDAVYLSAGDFDRTFAQAGGDVTGIRARQEIVSSKRNTLHVGAPRGTVAEGWTLSPHHMFNPGDGRTLYKGDGTVRRKDIHIIETAAGDGLWGYSGDGGPATEARLGWSNGVAVDAAGNLYISDNNHNVVRRVNADGIIETVAGNGSKGYSGDGGPAAEAQLNWPTGLTVDDRGNLYIVDCSNNRVRKVSPDGIITTVAGDGTWGYGGDDGPATQAQLGLDYPFGLAVDSAGNLYIADLGNQRIRKVDPAGIITTVAGNGTRGYSGDGGPAVEARLFDPYDIATDREGNLYIADNWNCRIRKVDRSGVITTVAGDGIKGNSGDGGPAVQARFSYPVGVSVDENGNIYILDQDFACIRKVDTSGIITTIAGNGTSGYSGDGGPAAKAQLKWPSGIAVDPAGAVYIADSSNYRIRRVAQQVVFPRAMAVGDVLFSEDGLGHVMSGGGLHKKTVDLDTGVTLYSFDYDHAGRLIGIIDRFDNRIAIRRDGNGVPVSITSPDGLTTSLTVDAGNLLSRITYPDGGHYNFEYTSGGLMTAKTEPEGNRFDRLFDSTGRLTDASDQEGGHRRYSRHVHDDGDILNRVLTAEGDLTWYTDRTVSTGAYTSTIADPTGAETLFSGSADGMTAEKLIPCGMEISFRYDFDPRYQSRYLKEIIKSTPSGLEKVTLREKTYENMGAEGMPRLITETVTVNGSATVLENDISRSRRNVTSPEGRTVTALYDPETLLTLSISAPGLHQTAYGYDAGGRLTSIDTHDRQISFSYDAYGFLRAGTDPGGRVTAYDYDPVGRLTGIDRPDGTSVSFMYDRNGNMTVLTGPTGVSHGFQYNAVNRRGYYHPPLSGTYSHVYDKDRRLVRTNFPSGKHIGNIYDRSRLSRIETPDGDIHFSYLCGTRLDTITRGTEAITYGYDGRLVVSEILSGTLNQSLEYTHDQDFNPMSISYAGATCIYSHDDDGILTGAGEFIIFRDPGNGLPHKVTGGALSLTRSFNGYGEVAGQSYVVGGQNKASWGLDRDDNGRITGKTEWFDGTASDLVYLYDTMGRLVAVTREGIPVEEYRYGPNGTRVHEMNVVRGISERSFTYSDEDHLLTAGSATYRYSNDGFLTSRTVGPDITEYDYSISGELRNVTKPDGTSIEYLYDPLGRRIARKVNGVVTEKFLWQGMTRLLAVYDRHNVLRMRFEYGEARMPYAMEKDGSRYYFVHDHLGSPTAVIDVAGNVVKAIQYDSFGNVVSDTAPHFRIPFGFAGGLYDPETGLIRFGFRDYDPDIGRWTAKDPILFASGTTDLYGYCLNDPVNLVDPLGLYSFQQFLRDTAAYSGVAATACFLSPGGQTATLVFAGIATGAIGLEIALYSQSLYIDTLKASIKIIIPVNKPYSMFTDYLTDLIAQKVKQTVDGKPCQ